MTFAKFLDLLQSKYPEASACAHGKFGGTERNGKVEINFTSDGKVYEYYGSYQEILNKVGVPVLYKGDVESAKIRLARYSDMNGKPNPFSLFNAAPCDYSKEINDLNRFLEKVENGEYIIM